MLRASLVFSFLLNSMSLLTHEFSHGQDEDGEDEIAEILPYDPEEEDGPPEDGGEYIPPDSAAEGEEIAPPPPGEDLAAPRPSRGDSPPRRERPRFQNRKQSKSFRRSQSKRSPGGKVKFFLLDEDAPPPIRRKDRVQKNFKY